MGVVQYLVYSGGVLFLESAGVIAKRVFPVVVAVLGHLINEEQRQHLDALREQFALLVKVGAYHLPDLDATLGFLGDVAIRKLPDGHDVTVAQLNHVTVGVDLGDEQSPVRLDAARDVVQVRPDVESLDLPLDRSRLRLHLQLETRPWFVSLGDLDGVQVQVSGGSS